jgi:hypothetical protein
LAIGGGKGSTILDKNKYRTFGIDHYGPATIRDTLNIKTLMVYESVAPRSVSPEELGELTYYLVCDGCHTYKTDSSVSQQKSYRPSMLIIQRGLYTILIIQKNLREDYPEMPS